MKIKIDALAELYSSYHNTKSMPLVYRDGRINYIIVGCDYDFYNIIKELAHDTDTTVNYIGIKQQMIIRNIEIGR